MANRTDPLARSVHGTNPQNLIEKILRSKIYGNQYWKEHCFGLTAETLVDKAVQLTHYGGMYGGMQRPTKFICLVLKMLQLQPEKEIIIEFIKNEDYKYLRVLGAFYLRLVGKPLDIYQYLEPLYNDYRKIRFRGVSGWQLKHVDELIDELLTSDYSCDVALPHLAKRHLLEDQKLLAVRSSALEELEDDDEELEQALEEEQREGEEEQEEDADGEHVHANGDGDDRERQRTEERRSPDDGGGGGDRRRPSRDREREDRDRPKSRERSPRRDSSRDRDERKERRDDRSRHRDQRRSRGRSRSRARRRSRSRSRDYRARDRSPDRDRYRGRSGRDRRDYSTERDRRVRSRSRSRVRRRDRDRSRSRSRDRRPRYEQRDYGKRARSLSRSPSPKRRSRSPSNASSSSRSSASSRPGRNGKLEHESDEMDVVKEDKEGSTKMKSKKIPNIKGLKLRQAAAASAAAKLGAKDKDDDHGEGGNMKETRSVGEWNDIRVKLGMKPLK